MQALNELNQKASDFFRNIEAYILLNVYKGLKTKNYSYETIHFI